MKTMLETFKKSIYNPGFYRGAAEVPLSEALRYYVKVSFLFAVVISIALAIVITPQAISFFKTSAPEMVKNYFPQELSITLQDGEAAVNVPEPYIIPGRDAAKEILNSQELKNLLVIDTKHNFDKETFEKYQTFALLTKKELVTKNDRGQITIQDLNVFPKTTIEQASLLLLVEKISASLVYVIPLGFLVTLLVMFFGYLNYLIILFLFALIPYYFARIKHRTLSYGAAYRMSLYAVVPALALKTILNMFGVYFLPAFFTFLVFALVVTINMREEDAPTLFDEAK